MLKTAQLKYPNNMETKFALGSDEKVETDFARVMAVSSVMIGIDQETYESTPHKEQFFVAFGWQH